MRSSCSTRGRVRCWRRPRPSCRSTSRETRRRSRARTPCGSSRARARRRSSSGSSSRLSAAEHDDYEHGRARAFADALGAKERAAQEALWKAHAVEVAAVAERLAGEVEVAHAAAGRSYHRSGTTYGEAAWEKWARARGLTARELDQARADVRFVTKGLAL